MHDGDQVRPARSWHEMQTFADVLPPVDFLYLNACMLPLITLLLAPLGWRVVAVVLAVDVAMLPLTMRLERLVYRRLYPDDRLFFPTLAWRDAAALDGAAQERLFDALVRFPGRRARFVLGASLVKTLPAGAVGYAACAYGLGLPTTALLVLLVCLLAMGNGWLGGATYMESHRFVSHAIRLLHERLDWTDVFRARGEAACRLYSSRPLWLAFAATSVGFVAVAVVVTVAHAGPPGALALRIGVLTTLALVLIGRLWYRHQSYLVGGLIRTYQALEGFAPSAYARHLPLHSSAPLARFESVFNQLMDRIRDYERELSQWVFAKAEESRYQGLGEIAGVIIHDLSTPLSIINFCAEQLRDSSDPAKRQQYLALLEANSRRSFELIHSLRAYLKADTDEASASVRVAEAVQHVVSIVATQYQNRGFGRIALTVAPELAAEIAAIPRPALIHVLLNVVGNAVANLLAHGVEAPWIRIEACARGAAPHRLALTIADNGTGLSPERYELLTGFAFVQDPQKGARSLGLRLARRIVERAGGTLLVRTPDEGGGASTTFELELPRANG